MTGITETLTIGKQTRGIFKYGAPVTERSPNTIFVSIDPGAKTLFTAVSTELITSGPGATKNILRRDRKYKKGPSLSSDLHNWRSLATSRQIAENIRRGVYDLHPTVFGLSLEQMSHESLNEPGGLESYLAHWNETLPVRTKEIFGLTGDISRDWRQKKQADGDRAQKRWIAKMANQIVSFGHRAGFVTVVGFGNGSWAPGIYGTVPLKHLKREIGLICTLVGVDEYFTSQKCFACGWKLEDEVERREKQCNNPRCPVLVMDRDENGACNIALVIVEMADGNDRPEDLRNPNA